MIYFTGYTTSSIGFCEGARRRERMLTVWPTNISIGWLITELGNGKLCSIFYFCNFTDWIHLFLVLDNPSLSEFRAHEVQSTPSQFVLT